MSAQPIGELTAGIVNKLAADTDRVKQFPEDMKDMSQSNVSQPRQEIVAHEEAAPPAEHLSEGAAVLNMIERAARDPSIDIEKLRQLMEMRNQMEARVAEREFDEAMGAAQAEMRAVTADADNSQTKSRYASYYALDGALRPIYTKHGFSLSFDTAEGAPEGHVRIVCKVARSGHRSYPHIDMPADGKGAKGGDVMTKTHATGSAITYGRRYLLGMIFNIAVGGDDDGNAAGVDPITVEQAEEFRVALDAISKDEKVALKPTITNFCKVFGVKALNDIPAGKYEEAKAILAQKQKAKA